MSIWDYATPDDEREAVEIPTTIEIHPETIENAERIDATLKAILPELDEDVLEADPDAAEDEPEVVPGQANLFGDNDQFTIAGQEWQGMPEYVSGDLTPWKSMLVHFENLEDLQAFAELVGQPITTRTKSIWYPASDVFHFIDKRYVAEEAS